MGLGEDGHIASIFPNQIQLYFSNNICEVSTHPISHQKRITITGQIINNAKSIIFFVTGENKAKITSEIFNSHESNKYYPASLVNSNEGRVTWILDTHSSQLIDSETQHSNFVF